MVKQLEQVDNVQTIPIEQFLKQEIKHQGWSIVGFAEHLEVSRTTIYNVVKGSSKISRSLAKNLALTLGHSPDFWLRTEVLTGDDSNVIQLHDAATVPTQSVGEGNAPQLLTDAMLRGAVATGAISITGYRSENQKSASYDLTLGTITKILAGKEKDMIDLNRKDRTIAHLEGVIARTKEIISLPKNYIARVGPTTDLAKMGLIVNYGLQIDPGFSGHLDFSIINMSGRDFNLFVDQVVLSIEVFYIPIAPERVFSSDEPESCFIEEIMEAVKGKLEVQKMNSGELLASWGETGIELRKKGTERQIINDMLELIVQKLEAETQAPILLGEIKALASEFTPSKEKLVEIIENPKIIEELRDILGETLIPVPELNESQETLRSVINQCPVSINRFFAAVLKVGIAESEAIP